MVLVSKRKILWDPSKYAGEPDDQAPPSLPATPEPKPEKEIIPLKTQAVIVQAKRAYKQRIGNGHPIRKTRNLTDPERTRMHTFFRDHNGQIGEDDCVANKTFFVALDVTIFQVTGYISRLHDSVAQGLLKLKDLPAYEVWMRTKYGALWARYNHPLYVMTRKENQAEVAAGKTPSHHVKKEMEQEVFIKPKFTTFPRSRRFL